MRRRSGYTHCMAGKGTPPACGCPSVPLCLCMERVCTRCGSMKPRGDFPPDRNVQGKGTRSGQCLECRRERDREYRASRTDDKKAYNSAYYQENAEHLKSEQRYRNAKNKERLSDYNKERHRDPGYLEWQADYNLRRNYGITLEEYEIRYALQDQGCAICGRADAGDRRRIRLHVDHDHQTSLVRGLLCSNCNRALGQFGDDPNRLRRAADYLEGDRPSDETIAANIRRASS